jgi:photosystem II stability/assembly factor-like uncharacterized protein
MKKLFTFLSLISLVFLLNSYSLFSQWEHIGPYGGRIDCFAIDSSGNIYAGSKGGGIYISTDNGVNWINNNTGLTDYDINTIIVKGINIFAGTEDGSIYLSTNNGNSWEQKNNGLPEGHVRAVVIKGNNIFVGVYPSSSGVYLSSDNGNNWVEAGEGLPNSMIHALAAMNGNIYAGIYGGVYISTNDGVSWQESNIGFPTDHVIDFTIKGNYIFAIVQGQGVFMSSDNGESWNYKSDGLYGFPYCLATKGTYIFAGTMDDGVYVSTNDGVNWLQVSEGLPGDNIQSLITDGANIYAGLENYGIYKSSNNGILWDQYSTGMGNLEINCFASNEECIYTGTRIGLFVSNDNGQNWKPLGFTPNIPSLVLKGDSIIVGTDYYGVWLSSDKGQNWELRGLYHKDLYSLAQKNDSIFAGTTDGVFLTTDFGQNWTNIGTYNSKCLAAKGELIFAGTRSGLYMSSDNGKNWIETELSHQEIKTILIMDDSSIVGTYFYGTYLSTDNGDSWGEYGLYARDVYSIIAENMNIFACAGRSGVFVRNRSSHNWIDVNFGLTNIDVRSSIIKDDYIFIGTLGKSIYRAKTNDLIFTITSSDEDNEICAGDAVTFTASGGTEYEFFLNNNSVQGPDTISTYTTNELTNYDEVWAEVAVGKTTYSTSTITTIVYALPFPSLGCSNNEICEGDEVIFTASASNPKSIEFFINDISVQGPDSICTFKTKLIKNNDQIYARVSNNNCYANSRTITMNVDSLPNPKITYGLDTVCAHTNYIYKSNKADITDYSWYAYNGTIIGSSILDSVIVLWDDLETGFLTLTQTNSRGCLDSIVKEISILSSSEPQFIQVPNQVCLGSVQEYICNHEENTVNIWDVSGGEIIGSNSSDTVNIQWSEIGQQILTLTKTQSETGCEQNIDTVIIVNALPATIITGPTESAVNCQETYYTESGYNNKWQISSEGTINSSDDADTIDIEWLTPGTGYLKLIQEDKITGCIDSTEIEVTILNCPKPVVRGDASVCEGTTAKYEITHNPDLKMQWYVEGGNPIGDDTDYFINIEWTEKGTGKVKVVVEDTQKGCLDSSEVSVTINSLPNAVINGKGVSFSGERLVYTTESNANYSNMWLITNGNPLDTTENSIVVRWQDFSNGKVMLEQTDTSTGCSKLAEKIITIKPITDDMLKINFINSNEIYYDISIVERILFRDIPIFVEEYYNQDNKIKSAKSFPNPTQREAVIEFEIGKSGNVDVIITNQLGKVIKTLSCATCSNGYNLLYWDGQTETGDIAPQGVYYYTVKFGNEMITKKMIIIK